MTTQTMGKRAVWIFQIKYVQQPWTINTLRPRQNGRHFPDDIFKCFFLNENGSIAIKIILKFVPNGPIKNILALVQIMAWRRPGDKPLSEPMMVSLPTYICVTRPQWVNNVFFIFFLFFFLFIYLLFFFLGGGGHPPLPPMAAKIASW